MVAGTYMTGILPIKKYAHQSAVSDFREYTMVDSAQYAPYVGFDEAEVEALCAEHGLDVSEVRRWCDGVPILVITVTYDVKTKVCDSGNTSFIVLFSAGVPSELCVDGVAGEGEFSERRGFRGRSGFGRVDCACNLPYASPTWL